MDTFDKLDKVDLQILRTLQENARLTTKELAARVSLSSTPVFERLKRLESGGYIKKYIALDGNVLSVAKTFFVHRNTVNNHLRKVKDITGINPLSLDGKILFAIAIKISELYDI